MKTNMRFGIGALLTAMLLLSMAFAPAVSATEDTQNGDIGIKATGNLGDLFTDGDNNIASATPETTGTVYFPEGYNTFTVNWKNTNDAKYDGQGAKYVLTVWDAKGVAHTTTKEVDQAGEGSISVAFNSEGAGDAQYKLYCDTHTYFGIDASDQYTGDLDYY
ncbi:MAG: hypothetical protein RBT65_08140 [Methanolobus sp.]|nr:hypothetical protein [Methanolobus sp.]